MSAAAALALLLALFPRTPALACLRARSAQIAAQVDEASRATGVPVSVLMAVGWHESHEGCARGSGGCFGAPVDAAHRHTAGRALHAAHALAASLRVCGTWPRAITRFRSGLCVSPAHAGYTARVTRLAARLDAGRVP